MLQTLYDNGWWIFLFYTIGSAYGWYVGFKASKDRAVEAAIDMLVDQKYVKWRTGVDGKIELLRYDQRMPRRK